MVGMSPSAEPAQLSTVAESGIGLTKGQFTRRIPRCVGQGDDAGEARIKIRVCLKHFKEIDRHLPQDERKQFFRFLLDRGYSIHRFISLTEYQGPRLGIEDVSRLDHYDLFAEPEGET